MDILWYGLKVALVGLLVVFFGLVLLIGCIRLLSRVTGGQKPTQPGPAPGDAPATPAAPPPPPVPTQAQFYDPPHPFTPGPALTKQDDALYAVITASVARTLEAEGINPEGGFAIRSVKAIGDAPPLTRRDDALYAVLTAAIARVLEAEGINPEGGFRITSVEAL